MPSKKKSNAKTVETIKHTEASRKNIPTAEYQSVMREDEKDPIRVAYERRNRDLDPQLVWRGKDEQDWSDLIVQATARTVIFFDRWRQLYGGYFATGI